VIGRGDRTAKLEERSAAARAAGEANFVTPKCRQQDELGEVEQARRIALIAQVEGATARRRVIRVCFYRCSN
jgi:hypothetical protein